MCFFLRAHLQQHVGKVAVCEFEVPFVVELEEGRTVRMLVLEVKIVNFRLLRRVSTLFAHVNLPHTKTRSYETLLLSKDLKKYISLSCGCIP